MPNIPEELPNAENKVTALLYFLLAGWIPGGFKPFSCTAFQVGLTALGVFLLSGCAGLGKSGRLSTDAGETIFLEVEPFGAVVREELKQVALDPDSIYQDVLEELRYQLFLNKLTESPDQESAHLKIQVQVEHLQPGSGSTGGLILGKLVSHRDGKKKEFPFELRGKPAANVPEAFLKRHVPRALSQAVFTRLVPSGTAKGKTKKSAIPQAMIVF